MWLQKFIRLVTCTVFVTRSYYCSPRVKGVPYSTKQQHQTLRAVACKNRLRPLSTSGTHQSFFAGPARFADPTRSLPAALLVALRRHFRAKTQSALDERIDVLFGDVRNKSRMSIVNIFRRKCRLRATLAFPWTLHRGTCLAGRDGAVDVDRLAPNCRSVLRPRADMTRVSIALSIRLQNRELLGSPEPQTICPQRAIVLVLFACAVVSVAVPAYRPWPLFLGLPHIILAV